MTASNYTIGEKVKVCQMFPLGHVRTPYFVRGHVGIIAEFCGDFANPEELAYGRVGQPEIALYRIAFLHMDLWESYAGSKNDKLLVDIYEHWLEPIDD